MGQRHQIFVRILNPIKDLSFDNNAEKKLAIEQLGTNKYTVLAYHNQWLYGRGALSQALHLLQFSSQVPAIERNGTKKHFGGLYKVPFVSAGYRNNFRDVNRIASAIGFILNFEPKETEIYSAGLGGSRYLNAECPEMRTSFDLGDNNDGITIIDLVTNKYCFMNIYDQETNHYSASDLPKQTPVDAKAYVTAYYGETIETINPYYLGNHERELITISREEQQEIVNEEIKYNALALDGFEEFKVLTLNEVSKIFPKMKLTKTSLV